MEKLYTVEDVAAVTGLTDRTIRNYLKDGTLTGKKIGVQWRFTEDDINQLFNKKELSAPADTSFDEVLLPFRQFFERKNTAADEICMVWDCPVENAFDLEHTCLSLLSNFSDDIEDEKVRFTYEHFESTGTARFLLSGRSEIVFHMIQMIRSEL